MFTHDDIWAAIDRLAETKGLSASGLARQAGLDPTAFNRSKRISPNGKPRWPSTESLSKILAVTNATMSDLIGLMDAEEREIQPEQTVNLVPLLPFSKVRAGKLTPSRNHEVFPVALDVGNSTFAFELGDERLSPLFRPGTILVVEPAAKPRADDRVLFYADGLKGGIFNCMYRRAYSIQIPRAGFEEEKFSENDVEWIARILWSGH